MNKILTGLAGVRGQLGLFTSPYSSCMEFRLAAPGEGTVLCGVGGWLWYPPEPPTTDPSLRVFGVQLGSSPEAVIQKSYIYGIISRQRD